MAIINCPECKEKISDSTNQCVHCGAKIKICPECKEVLLEKTEACPECGYMFDKKSDQKASQNNESDPETTDVAFKQWGKDNIFNNLILNHDKKIKLVLCIPWMLLIIAVIKFLSWISSASSHDLEKALSATVDSLSVYSAIKELLIVATIIGIICSIYDAIKYDFQVLNFTNWCTKKKIDIKNLIKNTFDFGFDKSDIKDIKETAKSLKKAIVSEVYTYDPEYKVTDFVMIGVDFLAEIVCLIISLTKFLNFISSAMHSVLTGSSSPSNGSFIKTALILIAIDIIISTIIDIIKKKSIEKRCNAYINENMPENIEKYNKYLIDSNEINISSDTQSL